MVQRHRPFSAIAILLLTIPFAFIVTDAARLGASTPSSSFSTQPQRKLPPGDDGPPKPPGITSDETGELEHPPESGGSTNPPPMSVHTEVQCNWWQRIAVDNDEDSSGGLDREEYFAFLNVISLDHFEGDDEDNGSWKDIFYKLAQPEPVDGDTILQVSIEGFSSNSVDPKTEKERKKIREKFCMSVFDGLIDEGVDESTMDLAIFMDGLFDDPTTKPKPKPPKPDSETEMETSTTTEATSATTAPIPTTTSQTSKSTTTKTTISSSTGTTRSPTTTTSEKTTTTVATTTSNPTTAEITTIPSPGTTTSTSTTTETTKPPDATTTPATIITSATTSAVNVDENSQESAISPELKNTTPATTIAATEAETTPVPITTVASTTSSSFNTTATTNATTKMTTLTNTISTPPQGGLPSELDKVIKVSAAVEQAMVRSDEMDESNEDSRSSRPSTGVIVGVIGGLAAMVVLIVAVVTRHPFFDPGRRERNNQFDD